MFGAYTTITSKMIKNAYGNKDTAAIEKKYLKRARTMKAEGQDDELIKQALMPELEQEVGVEDSEHIIERVMRKASEKSETKGNTEFKAHDANDRLEAEQKQFS